MNWYRVTISLKGACATPWQADTIFGHLCWGIRHRHGEAALRNFLEPFLSGEPPFLLSDGFPADLLPRPLTFSIPHADDLETFRAARKLRKQEYLSREDFLHAIRGELPQTDEVLKTEREYKRVPSRITFKNQISRLTGTTGETGQLFGFREYWTPAVTIYLKIQKGQEGSVEALFHELSLSGYGKRKSVGYGAIEQVSFDDTFKGFPIPEGANAFVTLSPFMPSPADPMEGRWRLRVKYGKLGEEFATGDNPFKRPLIMLTPGSVFFDTPVKESYGRLVSGVSVNTDVVHYAYALPVPMKLRTLTRQEHE